MNYIFIGGTYRGFKVIKSLIEHGHIPDYAVILKEDDHEIQKYSENIIELVKTHSIPYSFCKKLTTNDIEIIKNNVRDFAIVCGWRTLIPIELNSYFKLGMIAAHDSLLPKYRGFAPLNWAIINGEKKTGVTLFLINEGTVDSGDIINQETIKISNKDYAIDVFEKITRTTEIQFLKFVNSYIKNENIILIKQKDEEATYTCKRSPSDGKINWNESATTIYNLIRALAPPYPGAFCFVNKKKYTIVKAEIGKNSKKIYVGCIPGRVINIDNNGIEVLCKKGTILIKEWYSEESKKLESPSSIIKSILTTIN